MGIAVRFDRTLHVRSTCDSLRHMLTFLPIDPGDGQNRERKHLNTYDPDVERARGNSLRHNKNNRPGSALSGRSGKHGVPTPSGDVSEFSFQLK